jgi:hypothetical protein
VVCTHLAEYDGVLAGKHALRSRVVPHTHVHDDEPKQLALFLPRNEHELAAITKPLRDEQLQDRPPARLSWMKLLARVVSSTITRRGPYVDGHEALL